MKKVLEMIIILLKNKIYINKSFLSKHIKIKDYHIKK